MKLWLIKIDKLESDREKVYGLMIEHLSPESLSKIKQDRDWDDFNLEKDPLPL